MSRLRSIGISVFVFIATAWLSGGCSGRNSSHIEPQQKIATPVAHPLGLPVLAELAAATTRPRTVSSAVLERAGSEYEPSYGQLVILEGTDLRLTPDYPEGQFGLDGAAYAIYHFNLQGVEGTSKLTIAWTSPPEEHTDVWLGLSRWGTNSWEWKAGPAGGTLDLGQLAKPYYANPSSGDLFVAVVLMGTGEAVLQHLELNGSWTPTAQIVADPSSGAPPLTVNFDASGSSSAAGDIVLYEWDWDGSGSWVSTGDTPTASHEYETGSYIAWVRVTDELGGTDKASVSLSAAVPVVWPMFGRDPQHTHRSPYVGPQTNNVKWTFTTDGEIRNSPVIGSDDTVYVSCWDGKLYALNPDGSLKWSSALATLPEPGWIWLSTPAIGLDGTLYILVPEAMGFIEGHLYALNPDSSFKWKLDLNRPIEGRENLTVGADGTIFVNSKAEDGTWQVQAVNPDGSIKWSLLQGGAPIEPSAPAIGFDGTVFQVYGGSLVAINPGGSQKWEYQSPVGDILNSPCVGVDGTAYIAADRSEALIALNADGSVRWTYPVGERVIASPAIGADGTVYVKEFTLHAVNPGGSFIWEYFMGGQFQYIQSTPAIDSDGTLYVSSDKKMYAINPDGSVKWEYTTEEPTWLGYSSPAIGANGTVYVCAPADFGTGKVYAFGP